jgi:hypothetical protein
MALLWAPPGVARSWAWSSASISNHDPASGCVRHLSQAPWEPALVAQQVRQPMPRGLSGESQESGEGRLCSNTGREEEASATAAEGDESSRSQGDCGGEVHGTLCGVRRAVRRGCSLAQDR